MFWRKSIRVYISTCKVPARTKSKHRLPNLKCLQLNICSRITANEKSCHRIAAVHSSPRLEEQMWPSQLGNIAYRLVATLLGFQMADPTGLETHCHRLKKWRRNALIKEMLARPDIILLVQPERLSTVLHEAEGTSVFLSSQSGGQSAGVFWRYDFRKVDIYLFHSVHENIIELNYSAA